MEDMSEKYNTDGMDLIGNVDKFGVQVKKVKCLNTDDGLLGGNEDDLQITLSCGDESVSHTGQWEENDVSETNCVYDGVGTFLTGQLELECNKGDSIRLDLTEKDDWSADDKGGLTIGWDVMEAM